MNFKKLMIVLLLPLALNLFIGCYSCSDTNYTTYTNCSVLLENLDNTGKEPIMSETNMVLKEAFGLRISIELKEELCLNFRKPLFMSTAYATSCDCITNLFEPMDSILAINISTLMDFDSVHLSNDDISEYFSVLSDSEYMSIAEFIDRPIPSLENLENASFDFDLMLMTPPIEGPIHQFEVKIELTDGRILSAISNLIELI